MSKISNPVSIKKCIDTLCDKIHNVCLNITYEFSSDAKISSLYKDYLFQISNANDHSVYDTIVKSWFTNKKINNYVFDIYNFIGKLTEYEYSIFNEFFYDTLEGSDISDEYESSILVGDDIKYPYGYVSIFDEYGNRNGVNKNIDDYYGVIIKDISKGGNMLEGGVKLGNKKVDETKTEKEGATAMSKIFDRNKSGLIEAAKIKAGSTALAVIDGVVTPRLPMTVQMFASHPLFKIVIANLMCIAGQSIRPDDLRVKMLSDAVMKASYLKLMDEFPIEEMLEDILKNVNLGAIMGADDTDVASDGSDPVTVNGSKGTTKKK